MGRDPRGSVGAAGFQPEECHRTYQFARLVLDRRPTGRAGGRADAVRRAPVRRRCRSRDAREHFRSEEHTSELQSPMRISYAVFCLKKKKKTTNNDPIVTMQ